MNYDARTFPPRKAECDCPHCRALRAESIPLAPPKPPSALCKEYKLEKMFGIKRVNGGFK